MANLQALPAEILDVVIEHLIITIGIQKAVLLRTVSRAFDSAILYAICVSQVVDIDDPATPGIGLRMHPTLRGKIIGPKSHSVDRSSKNYLCVVAKVNSVLDSMIGVTSQEAVQFRHESIAGAVNIESNDDVDAQIEASNLLCGAAIVGNISVLKSLLGGATTSSQLNVSTPYFHSPLTLAAARGHLAAVQHLLDRGARLDAVASYWYRRIARDNIPKLADWNRCSDIMRTISLRQEPPSALRAAVRGAHGDVVRLLLRPKYRLNTDNVEYLRAIVAGASSGRLDLIAALFKVIGTDLSKIRGLGAEMLFNAVRCDQKEVVQWLVDKGIDVNAYAGHNGRDGIVEAAVCSGNASMVRFLIERGAVIDRNVRHEFGLVPIEIASKCGQEEVV